MEDNNLDINKETVATLTQCVCDILKGEYEKLSASAACGKITMSEYESWRENSDMYSQVEIDPLTGSFQHGITTTPQLFVSVTTTPVLCNGDSTGTVTENISGGTAPYVSAYTDLGGSPVNPAALPAGTYRLTVNDANNVTRVKTFIISEPPALTLNVSVSAAGPTWNATAHPGGGIAPYTYVWKDNGGAPIGQTTQTATGLTAGTYQVEVTDDNGCTIEDTNVVVGP